MNYSDTSATPPFQSVSVRYDTIQFDSIGFDSIRIHRQQWLEQLLTNWRGGRVVRRSGVGNRESDWEWGLRIDGPKCWR